MYVPLNLARDMHAQSEIREDDEELFARDGEPSVDGLDGSLLEAATRPEPHPAPHPRPVPRQGWSGRVGNSACVGTGVRKFAFLLCVV